MSALLKYTVTTETARIVDDTSAATNQLVHPFSTKRAVPTDLIELAREVQRADETVRCLASGKLQIIAEQIRFLQEQARHVLEDAKESALLHKAQCNFVKKPGTIYYLYLRSSGNSYFSMLSPQEWANCPHKFLGAYRLEHDRSWTKAENIPTKDQELDILDTIINTTTGVPSIEYLARAAQDHHDLRNSSADKPSITEHFSADSNLSDCAASAPSVEEVH